MLDSTCTQEQFGQLVGLGQPTVSGLLARGVLQPGQTAGQWLVDYCGHLREQAAGRGADGDLARERTRLASAQSERVERMNQVASGALAPVELLEQVLAQVGRTIAGVLEPLHVNLHKLCPALTADDLKLIQTAVAKACDLAVSASLDWLNAPDYVERDTLGSEEETDLEGEGQ